MERVRLIYEQIEEASRYLLAGSLLHQRLALILLDNLAELIMYHALRTQFNWYDHMVPSWELGRSEYIAAGLGPKYTEEERLAAEKEFEPKTRILSFRLHRISEDDRRILTVCQKIRCEAFHRGVLRGEILESIVRLLYLTVADLTVKLPFGSFSYSADEPSGENAAFLRRFGFSKPQELSGQEALVKLRAKLAAGVALEVRDFVRTLSKDLVDRIDGTLDGLSYVGETNDDSEIDHNLQFTQFWRAQGAALRKNGVLEPKLTEAFEAWQHAGGPPYTLAKIRRWRRIAESISRQNNPVRALDHWCGIDRRLAPLENDVTKAVFDYDEDINMRI
jgi:hypothetical protein